MQCRKIVILGPESTGKSTLCQSLAAHYSQSRPSAWVPEYAREFLTTHGMDYHYEDLIPIAKGQLALEEAAVEKLCRLDKSSTTPDPSNNNLAPNSPRPGPIIPNNNLAPNPPSSGPTSPNFDFTPDPTPIPASNIVRTADSIPGSTDSPIIPPHKSIDPVPASSDIGAPSPAHDIGAPSPAHGFPPPDGSHPRGSQDPVLFIDTDMYVMKVWSEFVFGRCEPWILDQIVTRQYDGYLLCCTDLPWSFDPLREYPDLENREKLFHIYKDIMVNQSTPWALVKGEHEERLAGAISSVDAMLKA